MSAKNRRTLEVDQVTPELEHLLAQFTDEEIETGVMARGAPATSDQLHTPTTLQHLLDKALLERSLARLLRSAGETANLSLADTAKRSGLTPERVQALEQESADLELHTLDRYANALGYDLQIVFVPRGGDAPVLCAHKNQPAPPTNSAEPD
jgi:DNA-binding phage protein